jgi:hypothetical protein
MVVASALGSAAFFPAALIFFEPLVLAFLAVAIGYCSPFDDGVKVGWVERSFRLASG